MSHASGMTCAELETEIRAVAVELRTIEPGHIRDLYLQRLADLRRARQRRGCH